MSNLCSASGRICARRSLIFCLVASSRSSCSSSKRLCSNFLMRLNGAWTTSARSCIKERTIISKHLNMSRRRALMGFIFPLPPLDVKIWSRIYCRRNGVTAWDFFSGLRFEASSYIAAMAVTKPRPTAGVVTSKARAEALSRKVLKMSGRFSKKSS
ncbi:hypothetical protein BDZ85DRAFT_124154 [Elsinoe ampelina]|uniref:Uncharacterized protein n=1 Tax=Elsinoe ampelina TaxID=302913 RepID=A0A6A6GCF4_9PEZI|nr:hypothetical protein BDZ85DRAFT_124154 [Elsinoe ampelina]